LPALCSQIAPGGQALPGYAGSAGRGVTAEPTPALDDHLPRWPVHCANRDRQNSRRNRRLWRFQQSRLPAHCYHPYLQLSRARSTEPNPRCGPDLSGAIGAGFPCCGGDRVKGGHRAELLNGYQSATGRRGLIFESGAPAVGGASFAWRGTGQTRT